jgi:AcrR family transcriptional regulator
MSRARAGVLEGALRGVTEHGTRGTTMTSIALLGGVAKATVYNHFRTKEEVWSALTEDELDRTAALAAAAPDLIGALTAAADRIAEAPARASLAAREPDVLSRLASAAPDDNGVRLRTEKVLGGLGVTAGPARVDLIVRLLASFLLAPGSMESRHATLEWLVAAWVDTSVEPLEVEPLPETGAPA